MALPKKGRPTANERAREQTPEFAAARQQHPAIESAINRLEHHGLQRIRSFGADGFARMVGLSIIAANLVRLGRLLRDKERTRLERQHRRRAAESPGQKNPQQTDRRSPSPQASGRFVIARPANTSDWVWNFGAIGPKNFDFQKKIERTRLESAKKGGFLIDTSV